MPLQTPILLFAYQNFINNNDNNKQEKPADWFKKPKRNSLERKEYISKSLVNKWRRLTAFSRKKNRSLMILPA